MKLKRSIILLLLGSFSMLFILISPITVNAASSVVTNTPKIIYHTPPHNWNPITATNEELTYYKYPQRPTDPKKLKEWKKAVSSQWVVPKFKFGKSRTKKQYHAPSAINSDYYYNWSGVQADRTSTRVVGEWVQPSISADSSHRPAYSCFWAGLGGTGTDPLIQAGSNGDISSSNTQETYLWWEIVGTSADTGGQQFLTSLPQTAAGDYVYVDISFNYDSVLKAYVANFYIANLTQSKSTSFSTVINSGAYTGSFNTAEWVGERTEVGSSLAANLTNWGSVYFRDCQYGDYGGTTTIITSSDSNLADEFMIPLSGGNYYLAFPGTIGTGGDFYDTWTHYN